MWMIYLVVRVYLRLSSFGGVTPWWWLVSYGPAAPTVVEVLEKVFYNWVPTSVHTLSLLSFSFTSFLAFSLFLSKV